jgi:hypothetical protein
VFRAFRGRKELRRLERLSPEALRREYVLRVRNGLLYAEMDLAALARRVEEDEARDWLEERHEAVSKIRQEFDSLLPN